MLLVLTILCTTLGLVDGLPAGGFLSRKDQKPAEVPCEAIDKYTVDV